MANNPTIVIASIDDEKLKKTIDSLVKHVNDGMDAILKKTDSTVKAMETKIKSLGNIRIDSGGSVDGGSSRRSKAQKAETDTTQQLAKANKELSMTYDQVSAAQQKAARGKGGISYMTLQSDVDSSLTYLVNLNKNVDAQMAEILSKEQALRQERMAETRAAQETAQEQKKITGEVLATNEQLEKARKLSNKGFGVSIARDNGSIPSFTTQLESAKALSAKLKELREQYNNLNFGQRRSDTGQRIAQQIREITRQSQILNNEINRPTKKEAFGLSEKTLDDLAYKMRQLSSYRSGLNVATQKGEITQVNDEYNRLKKRMDEVMQKNQSMIASNTALGRSWNYMKNRLAFYFTVGASTQFVKNLIEVRSQYEMNERALGILIDSAERGTQIFNELSQMALVSPYTLIELSSAAKQLTAYDIAAKDVVDTTRRLADMAAAVGIPIERLTYALGQIKAYGYLNSRDNRMFANAGIPLVKQLADYYTELEGRLVSTADVYDRIKKKSVGYEEVMSVIAKMTDEGGKFYDFQAKMAETLKVQLANLTLAWNNMLNAMGEETQGVLVGGINALKQMFLHWKDIEHILTEVVVALGAYKAYQIITTRLMGATAASLDAQILAQKRNNATMLERQSLTRKLTYDEAKLIATQNQLTASDYKNALSGKNLTKQKAMLLVALNMNNVQLKAAIVNMGLLTAQEIANLTVGKALAVVFKSIGISIKKVALAMKAFMVSNWWMIALAGLYELYHAWDSYDEHVKEINRSAAEHAKEAFENIKQYLESDVISQLRNKVVMSPQGVNDIEGQKAWDEMREKIELASRASNNFISKLLQEEDINKRLANGFDYLKDVERVTGVMQTLDEKAISVSTTTWGGVLGEGLKDDLRDFLDSKDALISAYGDIGKAAQELRRQQEYANVGIGNTLYDMQEFAKEVKKTTDSIYDVASQEGFNTAQQREFFERAISEIAQAEQLGAKETRVFRMQAEKEYYTHARNLLVEQLQYQQGAQKTATEERIRELDAEFGKQKTLQESFFTWVSEKHANEVRKRFGNMTKEEIAHIDWSQAEWAQWAKKLSSDFSKEYGVSFDELHKLVLQANTWEINIPVFFQTIGQPLSDVQRDYEARTGKKFKDNPLIKDAKSQVEILDILKKKQKEVANEQDTARKAGGKYWEENKKRFEDENNALVADIHAYNALTDAEEKANKKSSKAQKQAESELQKALKDELQLIDKVRSQYKKLSDAGVDSTTALTMVTRQFDESISHINNIFGKNGIPLFNIKTFAGTDNPYELLKMLQAQLGAAKSAKNVKPSEIKDLEIKYGEIVVDAKVYNTKKVVDGLNNELGKLKDEYELAVELDANPELGDMFADMFGINTATLPKTFGEAVERAQTIIDRMLTRLNISTPFDLMHDDVDKFAAATGIDKDSGAMKELAKWQDTFRDIFKKNIEDSEKMLDDYVKKYGDYSDKVAEIESDRLSRLKKLNEAYYTEEMRKLPEYAAKRDAINKGAERERSKAEFETFKESRYYTMMFENLDYISTKTIRDMRDRLRELMDTMEDMTPEQLKWIVSQYEKLEQKLVKRSPFKTLTKDVKAYFKQMKDRRAANQALMNTEAQYDSQLKVVAALKEQYEQEKANEYVSKSRLEFLKTEIAAEDEILEMLKEQVDAAEKKASQYNLTAKLAQSEAAQVAQLVASNLSSLRELRDELNEIFGVDASNGGTIFGYKIDGVIDGLSKLGDSISKTMSSAQSGNIVGVVSGVVGAVSGIVDSISSAFGGGAAKTKKANKEIIRSKDAVRELEIAYESLERTITKSLGTEETEARRSAIAAKEAVLAELERQKALEEGKRSKDKDNEAIKQYEDEIRNVRNEIADLKDDLVNNLLGEDVKSAAESFVDAWVQAWKAGETTLDAMKEKMDDIMQNIIKKAMTNKIVGTLLDPFYKEVDRMTGAGSEGGDRLTVGELRQLAKQAGVLAEDINYALGEFYGNLESLGIISKTAEESDKLSALQQGIQGITEETAGALEAYWNANTQQQYLQSDLLAQILNAIVMFNLDAQTATTSQILLQLQNSYQVQMSIQSTLSSWSSPNGMSVRVEMV